MGGLILIGNLTITGRAFDSNIHASRPGDTALPESFFLVNVVFTTVPGTLVAVERAGQLAHRLGAHIRILVPQVVPYPLPLDRPRVDPQFKLRHLRTRCALGSVPICIEVQLCRDARDCLRRALSPKSIVVLGGPQHWWPTKESRLTSQLKRDGHCVLFVPQHRDRNHYLSPVQIPNRGSL